MQCQDFIRHQSVFEFGFLYAGQYTQTALDFLQILIFPMHQDSGQLRTSLNQANAWHHRFLRKVAL